MYTEPGASWSGRCEPRVPYLLLIGLDVSALVVCVLKSGGMPGKRAVGCARGKLGHGWGVTQG
jgi:hypothetical protein